MAVERIQHEDRTEFVIKNLTRFGEEDTKRTAVILHKPDSRPKLKTISPDSVKEIDDPRGEGKRTFSIFQVPAVGQVVFLHDYDCDWSSATYRMGAHITRGPFIVTEKQVTSCS